MYPPCDTAALLALPLDRRLKRVYLVSVAQFRPEKDHAMQVGIICSVVLQPLRDLCNWRAAVGLSLVPKLCS